METLKKYKKDIILLIITIVFLLYFYSNYSILKINGSSMEPTYYNGQIIILEKKENIDINDLVVFSNPKWGSSHKIIKRVVAKKGDEFYIDSNNLHINENSFPHKRTFCNHLFTERIFIEEDEYFVMGDNNFNSLDSIYMYCSEKEDFLIDEGMIHLAGKEIFVLGGKK